MERAIVGAQGDWKLCISDTAANDEGVVTEWGLSGTGATAAAGQ